MGLTLLIVIIAVIVVATGGYVWFELNRGNHGKKSKKSVAQVYTEAAEQDVERIFNNEFREELRNRGRLHFEKIIGENAMFLQQDLRLTTSQLNEYMKQEITRTLQEEFSKYEESITDAKQLAIESITKTQEVIEHQRQTLSDQLQKQVTGEKENLLKRFDENMANIVNHYVLAAIGNQIDLSDQLEYILADLEANKQAILDDIRSGA